MNRGKRVSSYPNFASKFTKRSERNTPSPLLLEKIQRLYHQCNPRVLGHLVNLSDLFTSVILRGGYRSVCDKRKWLEVAAELKLPTACLNISVGLRRLYYQFLSGIELSEYPSLSENFLVQNSVELPSSESLNSELSSILLTPVERNLGISHIDVTDNRHASGVDMHNKSFQQPPYLRGQLEKADSLVDSMLTTDSDLSDPVRFRQLTEFRQSELALSSGLHNEVDAGLNCLLALSVAPLPHAHGMVSYIRLSRCSNLLHLVLASVGIFNYDECSHQLCSLIWVEQNRLNFSKFWNCAVRSPSGRIFLRPDVFVSDDLLDDTQSSASSGRLFAPADFPHPLRTLDYNTTTIPLENQIGPSIEESPEASRALLVATLLVNLVTPPSGPQLMSTREESEDIDDCELVTNTLHPTSLSPASSPLTAWKDNARVLASSPSALRFAFLCAHAHHSGLRQIGLQLLSGMRFPLEPLLFIPDVAELHMFNLSACRLAEFSLVLLNNCLFESEDRANLLSGLSLLSNLARVPQRCNETVLLTGLSPSVWLRLVELVCLPDLAIVCASLEALRCLTGMGAIACNCCWQACCTDDSTRSNSPALLVPIKLIHPLLALITLEGQAMGSQSLHRIKLMRRPVNYPVVLQSPHAQQPTGMSNHLYSQYRSIPPPPTISVLSGIHSHPRLPSGKPNAIIPVQTPVAHQNSSSLLSYTQPSSSLHMYPASIAKPLSLAQLAPSVPTQPKPPNTSCTSLINLLATPSVTSNSTAPLFHLDGTRQRLSLVSQATISSTSATYSITNSAGCDSNVNSGPFQPLGVATLSAQSSKCIPSPSELTDRLQMPPPSLPPPSALRRSGRWSLSRPGTPGTPTTSRIRFSSSCNSPPAAPKDQGGEYRTDSSSCVTQKPNSVTLGSPPKSSLSAFSSLSIPASDGATSFESRQFHLDAPPADTLDASTKVNGCWSSSSSESEEDCDGSGGFGEEEFRQEAKKSVPLSPKQQRLNGVKPSILQAAIVALHEGNSGVPHSRLLNGTIEENSDGEAPKPWFISNFDIKKAKKLNDANPSIKMEVSSSYPQQYELGTHQLVNGLTADSQGCHVDSSDRVRVEQVTVSVVNGGVISMTHASDAKDATCEGGSSSSSSSGSNSDTSSMASRPVRRRLFKRRRRGSARNRWIVHKKRKECDVNYIQSPGKSVTGSSPLKPLPFDASEAIPGSVLDPSWTPPHSLTMSAKQPQLSSSGSEGCHCNQYSTPTMDGDNQTSHHCPSVDKMRLMESHPRVPPTLKYLCEWESCHCSFISEAQVSPHVYNTHILQPNEMCANDYRESGFTRPVRRCCRWRGCHSAALPRAPFALMTHVLDYHCSKSELELRRREAVTMSAQRSPPSSGGDTQLAAHDTLNTSSYPLPLNDSPHSAAGADQTALSIIRQLEAVQFQADVWAAHQHYTAISPFSRQLPYFLPSLPPTANMQNLSMVPPPREGPVTKHLRVTAALILRNFVTHLPEARRWLLSETPLLSELIMGCSPNDSSLRTNDASHIIAQCLAICTRSSPSSVTVASHKPQTQSIRSFQLNHHYNHQKLSLSAAQLRRMRMGWHPTTTIRIPLPPVDMDAS